MFDRLFPTLTKHRWIELNLNQESRRRFSLTNSNPLLEPAFCNDWLQALHREHQVDHSFGGYLEDRAHLWHGHYHTPGQTVHLGIDFNVPAGIAVHVPVSSQVIFVYKDEDHNGGWGHVIGLVSLQTEQMYLMAHLSSCIQVMPGDMVRTGTIVAEVGTWPENGNWYEHLHIQCLPQNTDSLLGIDGYGPASDENLSKFPNPITAL